MTQTIAMKRMVRARATLIIDNFFFGSLALALKLEETREIKTAATDMRRLLFNPDFVAQMTDEELVFVWAHEVEHCEGNHPGRRGGREPELWNIACDHVDNNNLRTAGFKVPGWAYCDPQYARLACEQVYRLLKQEQDQQDSRQDDEQQDSSGGAGQDEQGGQAGDSQEEQSGQDIQGQGDEQTSDNTEGQEAPAGSDGHDSSSSEDQGQPGQRQRPTGKITDDLLDPAESPGEIAEIASEWEVMSRQALNVAKARHPGSVTGWLIQKIEKHDAIKVDWREVLRRFISSSSTKRTTWSRPNRRFIGQGTYLPGTVADGISHICWVRDTSGSMDHDALAACNAELQAALDEGTIDRLTVIDADADVRDVVEYSRGDQISCDVKGRGGTRFSPAFNWIAENAPDCAGIVYFSDLEVYDYGDEPDMPVLFAAYGDPRSLAPWIEKLPFGEVIEIEW